MPAIKAVIDTSVMISVAFPSGELARELRNMIADGAFTLSTSKEIMAELFRVLYYSCILKQFKPSKEDIDEFYRHDHGKGFDCQGQLQHKEDCRRSD
jgi:predicted nucleic acid-binding protein